MRIFIVVLSMCAVVACSSRPYRFAVWPDADASPPGASQGQAKAEGIVDHPCGWVREIEVARLPPPGSAGHVGGTEMAIEFDDLGGILRRWSLPVDALPLAVDGPRLEFDYGGRGFVVDGKGRLRETARRERPGEPIECPEAIEAEYRGSQFLMCVRMADLGTGASRRLAFEGVCT